jgi:hypothetical protein
VKLYCPDGEHEVKVAFNPSPGERWCPDHEGVHLQPLPKKASNGFRSRAESPARRAAREHFNRAVKRHRCFYSAYRSPDGKPRREDHHCIYPLDAHHIITKQWIETNYADLPEDELLEILFDPRIGAPLCRAGHENVVSLHIYWDEVSAECIEACQEVDRRWLDVPTPAGIRRQSMCEELRRVCPKRKEVAVTVASGRSTE